MTLSDIVQILRTAPRISVYRDRPQGARCIQISDTVANEMVQTITETCQLIGDQARIIQHTADTAIANEMTHRAQLSNTTDDVDKLRAIPRELARRAQEQRDS